MSPKWYEKNVAIILFLIFLFPVGLFFMWKYSRWNKTAKIAISIVVALGVIVNVGNSTKITNTKTANSTVQERSKGKIGEDKVVDESKVTYENFLNIKMGQSYDEVIALLGEGKESSSSEISDIKTTIYRWNGKGISNISVTIQNGIVTAKTQAGLSSNETDITMDNYNKIENGMTYEQVKSILGEGEVTSQTEMINNKSIMYSYINKDGSYASFTFTNDSMSIKAQFNLKYYEEARDNYLASFCHTLLFAFSISNYVPSEFVLFLE